MPALFNRVIWVAWLSTAAPSVAWVVPLAEGSFSMHSITMIITTDSKTVAQDAVISVNARRLNRRLRAAAHLHQRRDLSFLGILTVLFIDSVNERISLSRCGSIC